MPINNIANKHIKEILLDIFQPYKITEQDIKEQKLSFIIQYKTQEKKTLILDSLPQNVIDQSPESSSQIKIKKSSIIKLKEQFSNPCRTHSTQSEYDSRLLSYLLAQTTVGLEEHAVIISQAESEVYIHDQRKGAGRAKQLINWMYSEEGYPGRLNQSIDNSTPLCFPNPQLSKDYVEYEEGLYRILNNSDHNWKESIILRAAKKKLEKTIAEIRNTENKNEQTKLQKKQRILQRFTSDNNIYRIDTIENIKLNCADWHQTSNLLLGDPEIKKFIEDELRKVQQSYLQNHLITKLITTDNTDLQRLNQELNSIENELTKLNALHGKLSIDLQKTQKNLDSLGVSKDNATTNDFIEEQSKKLTRYLGQISNYEREISELKKDIIIKEKLINEKKYEINKISINLIDKFKKSENCSEQKNSEEDQEKISNAIESLKSIRRNITANDNFFKKFNNNKGVLQAEQYFRNLTAMIDAEITFLESFKNYLTTEDLDKFFQKPCKKVHDEINQLIVIYDFLTIEKIQDREMVVNFTTDEITQLTNHTKKCTALYNAISDYVDKKITQQCYNSKPNQIEFERLKKIDNKNIIKIYREVFNQLYKQEKDNIEITYRKLLSNRKILKSYKKSLHKDKNDLDATIDRNLLKSSRKKDILKMHQEFLNELCCQKIDYIYTKVEEKLPNFINSEDTLKMHQEFLKESCVEAKQNLSKLTTNKNSLKTYKKSLKKLCDQLKQNLSSITADENGLKTYKEFLNELCTESTQSLSSLDKVKDEEIIEIHHKALNKIYIQKNSMETIQQKVLSAINDTDVLNCIKENKILKKEFLSYRNNDKAIIDDEQSLTLIKSQINISDLISTIKKEYKFDSKKVHKNTGSFYSIDKEQYTGSYLKNIWLFSQIKRHPLFDFLKIDKTNQENLKQLNALWNENLKSKDFFRTLQQLVVSSNKSKVDRVQNIQIKQSLNTYQNLYKAFRYIPFSSAWLSHINPNSRRTESAYKGKNFSERLYTKNRVIPTTELSKKVRTDLGLDDINQRFVESAHEANYLIREFRKKHNIAGALERFLIRLSKSKLIWYFLVATIVLITSAAAIVSRVLTHFGIVPAAAVNKVINSFRGIFDSFVVILGLDTIIDGSIILATDIASIIIKFVDFILFFGLISKLTRAIFKVLYKTIEFVNQCFKSTFENIRIHGFKNSLILLVDNIISGKKQNSAQDIGEDLSNTASNKTKDPTPSQEHKIHTNIAEVIEKLWIEGKNHPNRVKYVCSKITEVTKQQLNSNKPSLKDLLQIIDKSNSLPQKTTQDFNYIRLKYELQYLINNYPQQFTIENNNNSNTKNILNDSSARNKIYDKITAVNLQTQYLSSKQQQNINNQEDINNIFNKINSLTNTKSATIKSLNKKIAALKWSLFNLKQYDIPRLVKQSELLVNKTKIHNSIFVSFQDCILRLEKYRNQVRIGKKISEEFIDTDIESNFSQYVIDMHYILSTIDNITIKRGQTHSLQKFRKILCKNDLLLKKPSEQAKHISLLLNIEYGNISILKRTQSFLKDFCQEFQNPRDLIISFIIYHTTVLIHNPFLLTLEDSITGSTDLLLSAANMDYLYDYFTQTELGKVLLISIYQKGSLFKDICILMEEFHSGVVGKDEFAKRWCEIKKIADHNQEVDDHYHSSAQDRVSSFFNAIAELICTILCVNLVRKIINNFDKKPARNLEHFIQEENRIQEEHRKPVSSLENPVKVNRKITLPLSQQDNILITSVSTSSNGIYNLKS